jgi:hypothetical protein
VWFLRHDGDRTVLAIASGRYAFSSPLARSR